MSFASHWIRFEHYSRTAPQPRTEYTLTATDADGDKTTWVFHLTIEDNTALDFDSASEVDRTFTSGTEITPLQLPEPTGGNRPLRSYAITSGALPQGLVFNTSTRTISGTPVGGQERTRLFMTATDRNGDTGDYIFYITIEGVALASSPVIDRAFLINSEITPIQLPEAKGIGTLTYTTTALPPGLSFDPDTRRISGTPIAAQGKTIYTLTATDGVNSATFDFYITVDNFTFVSPAIERIFRAGAEITPIQLPETTSHPQTLTYTTTALPPGLSFDPVTRRISGTPTTTQERRKYTLTATNGVNLATFDFYITVEGITFVRSLGIDKLFIVNSEITPIQMPEATNGMGALTYTTTALPSGLSFDSDTRRISGIPTATQTRTLYTLTAVDEKGNRATFDFHITVVDEDTQLTFGSIAPIDWTFTPENIDNGLFLPEAVGGKGRLIYTLNPSLPEGLRFDVERRTIVYCLDCGVAFPVTVTKNPYVLTAEDEEGNRAAWGFFLTVEDLQPSFPPVTVDDILVKNDFSCFGLPVSIDNGHSRLAISPHPPRGIRYNHWDPDTGTFVYCGTPNTVQPRTEYTMVVTDSDGDMGTFIFHLTVEEDLVPDFSAADAIDMTFASGAEVNLQLPEANSGNGDLIYTITSGALPPGLVFNTFTRRISGTPRQGEGKTQYTLTAFDVNGDSDTYDFHLTVEGPTFGSLSAIDRTFNIDREITPVQLPEATGGTLTYTTTALPTGLVFNEATRRISGTPAASQPRTRYTLTATDMGGNRAFYDFYIAVREFTFGSPPAVDKTFPSHKQITAFQLPEATGASGTLTYTTTALPEGLSFDSATRRISGTPITEQARTLYTLTATDGDGVTAIFSFHITIMPNSAPIFRSPTAIDKTYELGNTGDVQLPSAEGGNGELIYTIMPPLPYGLVFHSVTHSLVLDRNVNLPSTQSRKQYTLTATDEDGDMATFTFTITVEDIGPDFGSQTVDEELILGRHGRVDLPFATGGNGGITYTISPALPMWLRFISSAHVLDGTPTDVQGKTTYTLTARDRDLDTATMTFSLAVVDTVGPPPEIPQLTVSPGTPAATEGGTLTFSLVLSHTTTETVTVAYALTDDTATHGMDYTVSVPSTATSGMLTFAPGETSQTVVLSLVDDNEDETDETVMLMLSNLSSSANFSGGATNITSVGTITDNDENTRPVFASSSPIDNTFSANKEIDAFQLPEATGGDGALTYSITGGLPTGLSFDPATRTISGTPAAEQGRTEYALTVGDSDSDTSARDTDTFNFYIMVEPNTAPDFGSQTVDEELILGRHRRVDLPFATGGNGEITYTISPALPTGLRFIPSAHVIDGTPTTEQGRTTYTLTATDRDGDTDQMTFALAVVDTVGPPPEIPQLTVSPGTPTATEGGTLTFSLVLSHTTTETVTVGYTLTDDTATHGMDYTVSVPSTATSGMLTFEPGETLQTVVLSLIDDNEDETDETVMLTLNNLSSSANFPSCAICITPSIISVGTITDNDENTQPVFASSSPIDNTFSANKEIAPFQLPEATGGDGALTYSITGGLPAGLSFDSGARTVSGTPTTEQGRTEYILTVGDSDGDTSAGDADTFNFHITVEQNTAPDFGSQTLDVELLLGRYGSINLPLARDGSGNGRIDYEITPALPSGLLYFSSFHRIDGTPDTAQGRTTYTLTATDRDGDTDQMTFSLTVVSPQLTVSPGTPAATEGGTLTFSLVLSDTTTEMVTVAYALTDDTATHGMDYTVSVPSTATSGMLTFEPGETSQTVVLSLIDDNEDETDETVMLTLSNLSSAAGFPGGVASITSVGTITDNDTNTAPVFDSRSVIEETLVRNRDTDLPLSLPEVDGDSGNGEITYSITPDLPTGLAFDSGTLAITGVPTVLQGPTEYTLTAGDSDGDTSAEDTDTFTFSITVEEDRQPVFAERTLDVTFVRGNFKQVPLPTVEGNGDITYAIDPSPPSGLNLTVNTLHGRPDTAQPRSEYTITARDKDGDMATMTLYITISETPQLTVSASSPTIAEHGGALTFSIALDSAAPETVTVDYALTGTAQPGPDYTIDAPLTSAAGVLVFSPGSALQQTIVLSLVDDRTHENDETVVLTLNNLTVAEFPGGADAITSVVTITDNDEDPNAFIREVNTQVLPKIAMTIASEAAGAIRDRIKEAFSGVSSGVYVRGGGWRQFLAAEASRDNERAEMPDIKLSDLSFALAADEWGDSDYDYGGGSMGFRAWGRGYYHDVDFGGDIIFDGGITGGMVGVDTIIMSNLLTGVSANLFNADINFSRSGLTPRAHETTAWSVHPYIGWRPLARTTVWGTAGYGMGDIKVEGEEESCGSEPNCHNSDINLLTLGGGGSVLIGNVKFGSGRVSLDMLGDVALARISEGGSDGLELDAGVARFGIEMGYGRPLGLNGNLGGDIGLSYRADFGDIKSGSGLEAGGGLNITIPGAGLRFEGNGRALLSGIDSVDEWGFSGDIIWSYNSDNGTGPYIIFRPEWGATNDKRDDLWERGVAELEVTEDSSGQRYVMEAGYGVALMGDSGVMTFFARNEMEGGEAASQSGGLDIEMTGGLSIGYETVSRTSEQPEHRGYLRYAGKF